VIAQNAAGSEGLVFTVPRRGTYVRTDAK